MIYDLTNTMHVESLRCRLNVLVAKGACVELTEKAFRTRRQNSYLHALIGVVAMATGNNLNDTKEWYFKRLVNADLFVRQKTDALGHSMETLRSSADLTKEEMTTAIDRFKRWGAENGIYMPSQSDELILRDIEIEMGRMQNYL